MTCASAALGLVTGSAVVATVSRPATYVPKPRKPVLVASPKEAQLAVAAEGSPAIVPVMLRLVLCVEKPISARVARPLVVPT